MSLTTTYDPQNIFAQIIRGDAPCYKLYEDDDVLAFLDLFPQSFGHTLVIPKRSAACNILDVDSEALAKVIKVVQKLTRAIVAELEPDGVGLGIHAAGKAEPAELEKLQARLLQRIAALA